MGSTFFLQMMRHQMGPDFFFKGGSNLQIKSMVLLKDLPWMLCVKFGLVSYNEPCMMLSPKDMENVFPQFLIVLSHLIISWNLTTRDLRHQNSLLKQKNSWDFPTRNF